MNSWESEQKGRVPPLVSLLDSFKKINIASLFTLKRHAYDNLVARLNFSFLSKILVMESILLTCKELFGEEISCVFSKPPNVNFQKFHDICWIDGAYTVIPGTQSSYQPYVGVSTSVQTDNGSKYYHRYYQWIYSALLIQSAMFYGLKWVWSYFLDSRFMDLVGKLRTEQKNLYEYKEPDRLNIVQSTADLLFSGVTFYNNVILIELICLVHIVFQIWATDRFLNGNFHQLGIIWLEWTFNLKSISSLFVSSASTAPSNPAFHKTFGDTRYSNANDPLQLIFPRMVKCTLQFFGLTGDINSYDGMCFLAANSLHEKIYLFQWFLFHFMLVLIILTVIYRLAILVLPPLRYLKLYYTGTPYAARAYRGLLNSPGKWFLLDLLSSTLQISHFIDLMDAVMESHFDKYGKPRYNSVFGQYTKERSGVVVDRSVKKPQKVKESESWNRIWPGEDPPGTKKMEDSKNEENIKTNK